MSQLNEATRELASLRVANARLKAAPAPEPARATESSRGADAAAAISRGDPTDEKLAASLRSYSQFKQDLATLMAQMEKARAEHATLTAQVRDASQRAEEAKAALSRVESDLRREKATRIEAEQTATKLREQLRTIARAMSAAGLNPDKIAGDAAK